MNYLKSEHLKFKRTITNKLIFIIPLMTAIFAWLVGGFISFQYLAFYWWYAFLLPGTIALFCSLSHRKEEAAGKYYSVFSLPIKLSKFELAKNGIIIEKLVCAAVFLAVLISLSRFFSPATAVYSTLQSIVGSVAIIIASVWQVPICLYLARRIGLFLPILLNTVLSIFFPAMLGNTALWYFVPHCYAAKLAEPLLGIKLNGTFAENAGPSVNILISILLSLVLFLLLSYFDASDFSKGRHIKCA